MEQVDTDIGSASFIMGGVMMLFGSIGTSILSINSINRVVLLGLLYLMLATISSLWW